MYAAETENSIEPKLNPTISAAMSMIAPWWLDLYTPILRFVVFSLRKMLSINTALVGYNQITFQNDNTVICWKNKYFFKFIDLSRL